MTKSGKPKVFPFRTRLEKILLRQRERVNEVQRTLGIKTSYVFIRFEDGAPLVYFDQFSQREKASNYFYKHWHKALESAKIIDKRPHGLRRAAAIRRDAAGMSQDDNRRAWWLGNRLHVETLS